MTWSGYYNSQKAASQYHSGGTGPAGNDGAVVLGSMVTVPSANNIGPQHVDACMSPSCGVWYPDILKPAMAWYGGGSSLDGWGGVAFNPFLPIPNQFVVRYYTERLPSAYNTLQWMMPQYGFSATDKTRGNLVLANLEQKPSDMAKVDFLAMGQLRSYPHGQLRRLCVGLRNGTLPLTHPMVGVLIRQTLYHLGDLVDTNMPFPGWRRDLLQDEAHELVKALQCTLETLAARLEPMPREHMAIPVLGEIASVLSEWHAPCRTTARKFADVAQTWARDIERQIQDADFNPQRVSKLRAKQCIFHMFSLMCYSPGELDREDAAKMCELVVLTQQGRIFGDSSQVLPPLISDCSPVRCCDLRCVSRLLAPHSRMIVHRPTGGQMCTLHQ